MKNIILRDDEYFGKDDMPYCKKCNTARAGIFFEDKVSRHLCKCETAQRDFEEGNGGWHSGGSVLNP